MRGRRSELIETDGVLWFPRDVEEAFCAIDGVAQAAVVGVADPALGQRPHAFITAAAACSSHSPGAVAQVGHCQGKVRYDLAALQVSVVEQLPMTPTGKIAKGELRRPTGECLMSARDWWDLTTEEFSALDAERTVALLPVCAVEQHGPHLPVRVDAAINAGILARAIELVADESPLLVLPAQNVGKSDEHTAFAGTLTINYETLGRLWFDLAQSVHRAGCRKIIFFNSHGGQPQLIDIVCRELRVQRLNML